MHIPSRHLHYHQEQLDYGRAAEPTPACESSVALQVFAICEASKGQLQLADVCLSPHLDYTVFGDS